SRVVAKPGRWRPGVAVTLLAAGAVGLSVLGLVSGPLELTVRGVTPSRGGRSVDTVTVTVSIRTGRTVALHFLVNTGDNPDGFWQPARGRAVVLRPYQATTLTLHSPIHSTAPQKGAGWLVEAYTSSPRALSTSPNVIWRRQ